MKEVFSTGEAAKICRVSQQTIIRCFDSGELQGFYVPGSRFRRIPREALEKFMKENGIPLSNLDPVLQKVLVVDDEPEIVELLVDALQRDGRFEVKSASCGCDACILTQQFHPDVIVLDYMLPDINADVVVKAIRSNPNLDNVRVIIISGMVDEPKVQELYDLGIHLYFRKSFQIDELIDAISVLGMDKASRLADRRVRAELLRQKKVLIVDDYSANVKLLERNLTTAGYATVAAYDGEEALAKVQEEHPDVILLDTMLPRMDGFEVCRRLRADQATAGIPVIMITALKDTEDRIRGLEAGADDFISKPFDRGELLARVRVLSLVSTSRMPEFRDRYAALGPGGNLAGGSSKLKVLIVDDYPANVKMLERNLEAVGYATIAAYDGEDALAKVHEEHPDVILLDIMLPKLDGFEVCRRLRADQATAGIPVITITALKDTEDRIRGLEAGADDFISKPFDRGELLARVRCLAALPRDLLSVYHRREAAPMREATKPQSTRRRSPESMKPTQQPVGDAADLAALCAVVVHKLNNEFALAEHFAKEILTAEGARPKVTEKCTLIRNCLKGGQELTAKLVVNVSDEVPVDGGLGPSETSALGQTARQIRDEFVKVRRVAEELRAELPTLSTGQEQDALEQVAEHAIIRIRRLLDWLDLGTPLRERIDLVPLLKRAEALARRTLPDNVVLEVHVDPSVSQKAITADEEELKLILLELIQNASNALLPTGGRIDVIVEDRKQGVAVLVRDTGPGIPRGIRKWLFKKRVPSKKGLGMGLFLCNRIVQGMGGQMKLCRPLLKRGTTVEMVLPAFDAPGGSDDAT